MYFTLSVIVLIYILFTGAIFDSNDRDKIEAFEVALEEINSNESLKNYTLEPLIKIISLNSPLTAVQTACSMISKGVVAIFGPDSDENAYAIQSVCDTKEVPHIESRWDAKQERGGCLVNLFPHSNILSKILVDLVNLLNWKGFTVLYEDDDSLQKISEILKLYDNQGRTIAIKQLDKFRSGNYRQVGRLFL